MQHREGGSFRLVRRHAFTQKVLGMMALAFCLYFTVINLLITWTYRSCQNRRSQIASPGGSVSGFQKSDVGNVKLV